MHLSATRRSSINSHAPPPHAAASRRLSRIALYALTLLIVDTVDFCIENYLQVTPCGLFIGSMQLIGLL